MSKIFIKLHPCDVVYASGGKRFKSMTKPLAAGLYDEKNNLIASWSTLKAYGLNVEKDSSDFTYKTDTTSGYYVLTKHSLLSKGKKLVIGDDVERIGKWTFCDCNLKSVEIPGNVKTIASHAFRSCNNLERVVLHNGVTTITYAFDYCCSIKSIVIPDSVTSVGSFTFFGCDNLVRVVLGNSVTEIDAYVFENCESLSHIIIPKSVTSINNTAFDGCSSLSDIYYTGTEAEWAAIKFTNTDNLQKATIHYNYQG